MTSSDIDLLARYRKLLPPDDGELIYRGHKQKLREKYLKRRGVSCVGDYALVQCSAPCRKYLVVGRGQKTRGAVKLSAPVHGGI